MKYYNIYFRFKLSIFFLSPKLKLYIITRFQIIYAGIREYTTILYAIFVLILTTLSIPSINITVCPMAFANIESINIIKLNSGKYEKCSSCEYEKICKGCCPSRMVFNEKYDVEDKDCALRKAIFRILKEDRIQEEMNG